jgi:hypothetical protein
MNVSRHYIFLFMVIASCAAIAKSSLNSTYESAIERAARAVSGHERSKRLRALLRDSVDSWEKNPAFAEARETAAELPKVSRQIKIEAGNVNSGNYSVMWFVETDGKVIMLTNAFSPKKVKQGEVRYEDWDRLVSEFSALKVGDVCGSAMGVSDGTGYFGIFSSHGEVKTFAVYGAVPFPRIPGDMLYRQLAPCSEIILKAHEIARSVIAPG